MIGSVTLQKIKDAGFSSESDSALTYDSLLRLADKNDDSRDDVHAFLLAFPPDRRSRYVGMFRADELLSHYRSWKAWRETGSTRGLSWVHVMQSRANNELLKIWFLGEDKSGISGCIGSFLAAHGINIEENYGAVTSGGEKFSILSVHVKEETIKEKFGGAAKSRSAAMLVLNWELKDCLTGFFEIAPMLVEATGTGTKNKLVAQLWSNDHFLPRRKNRNGLVSEQPQWSPIDIKGVDNPSLHDILLVGLLFSPIGQTIELPSLERSNSEVLQIFPHDPAMSEKEVHDLPAHTSSVEHFSSPSCGSRNVADVFLAAARQAAQQNETSHDLEQRKLIENTWRFMKGVLVSADFQAEIETAFSARCFNNPLLKKMPTTELQKHLRDLLSGFAHAIGAHIPLHLCRAGKGCFRITWRQDDGTGAWDSPEPNRTFGSMRQLALGCVSDSGPASVATEVLVDQFLYELRSGAICRLPGLCRTPASTQDTTLLNWIPPSVDPVSIEAPPRPNGSK